MKRKRGAPPGNQNAFKHGFYSALFKQQEMRALSESPPKDLVDEIGLVRVATSRFLAALQAQSAERDIETEISILRVINLGALSINGMVRTQLMMARGAQPSPETLRLLATLDAQQSSSVGGGETEDSSG